MGYLMSPIALHRTTDQTDRAIVDCSDGKRKDDVERLW